MPLKARFNPQDREALPGKVRLSKLLEGMPKEVQAMAMVGPGDRVEVLIRDKANRLVSQVQMRIPLQTPSRAEVFRFRPIRSSRRITD